MEPKTQTTDTVHNVGATLLVTLQVLAWLYTVNYFSGDYTGSDAAGNGMSRGFAVMIYIIPSMVFIFLSNLYLVFKKSLIKPYRYIAAANFVGLFFCLTVSIGETLFERPY